MATMEAVPSPAGSMPQPYPSLPASPTLTNPDMILPDYERAASPADDLDLRAQSPLMMWKNAHAAASGDIQHMFTTPSQQLHNFNSGPITPTTPIIYGNGTMLSDIGEVTEVESTPGRPSPSRRTTVIRASEFRLNNEGSGSDTAMRSSPTMGYSRVKQQAKEMAAQRERRSSMESNSTITTQDAAGLFADFDDTVSVGDSVFQGDDEESMASSYVPDDAPPRHEQAPAHFAPSTVNSVSDAGSNRYSTASLSQRAEQILANAKRRLTTMEGNLNRARTSLYIASPSSLSSLGSDGSTPSPPIVRAATALNHSTTDMSSPDYSPGHSRMGSDNSLRIGLPIKVYPQRSASALGAAGGYRKPLTGSKSVPHLNGQFTRTSTREIALEPLSEDEVAPTPQPDPASELEGQKLETFLSPTFGSFNERGLTRSASVAQMRDLKDQMKGLKGKISSLREQARADSMKRRSLQSLRTPSPFTHAQVDQWYAEPKSADGPGSGSGGNDSAGRNPWNGEESSVDGENQEGSKTPQNATEDEESIISSYDDADQAVTQLSHPGHVAIGRDAAESIPEEDEEEDDEDMQTENGDVEEEPGAQDMAYESESGESLYHDSVQQQLSHEDREDAFDYEHFFLHSAMGTISQQRLERRRSRESFSSNDSVETTRGPIVAAKTDSEARSRSLSRRASMASTSTDDSFATADEGRSSRHGSGDSGSSKEEISEQVVNMPALERSGSPETAKRATFSPGMVNGTMINGRGSSFEDPRTPQAQVMNSTMRRPMSTSATMAHRPSISSFESTGTNRSFPLVNRKKAASTGILTPQGSSPDRDLKAISDSLMNETASVYEREMNGDDSTLVNGGHKYTGSLDTATAGRSPLKGAMGANDPAAMQTLPREDQYLVERLVASLGRCVLGLTESGRASSESRMYRRRIEMARRILEGLETV